MLRAGLAVIRTGRADRRLRTGRAVLRTGRARLRTGRAVRTQAGTASLTLVFDGLLGLRAQAITGTGRGPTQLTRRTILSGGTQRTGDRRRRTADVTLKVWPLRAVPTPPQVCKLCADVGFHCREEWEAHVNAEHGGLQRYRNAVFSLQALTPYVVTGSEWRAVVANFAEFYARSSVGWDGFTPDMIESMRSPEGLQPGDRWKPRARAACVFCARLHWTESLSSVFLAGDKCFMANPEAVADLLSWEAYAERWPDIPPEELRCSAVPLRLGSSEHRRQVLLHKRRVSDRQADGAEAAYVCQECYEAFSSSKPELCKYALANDLWLGRWHPVLRRAHENLSHQMLLALARIVTTKIALRPETSTRLKADASAPWDFLFHQKGMIGSAILFGNARCNDALPVEPPPEGEPKPAHYPPPSLEKAIAVTFTGPVPPELAEGTAGEAMGLPSGHGLSTEDAAAQRDLKRAVSKVAKLKVTVDNFLEESRLLQAHNYVYKTWASCDESLLARWNLRPGDPPKVPEVVLDTVVAVPTEEGCAALALRVLPIPRLLGPRRPRTQNSRPRGSNSTFPRSAPRISQWTPRPPQSWRSRHWRDSFKILIMPLSAPSRRRWSRPSRAGHAFWMRRDVSESWTYAKRCARRPSV